MKRWWIIGTLFLATTINYIDRQALSVAAPVIKEDLDISNEGYGWIVSAFLLAYAIMQFLSGRIVDKIGVKKGFNIAVIWWSIAAMLHALGRGVWSLGIARFLLGIGEAANYPTAMKAISKWFPDSEKSKAVGILNMGPGLGAIIAPPLMAWLILTVGWKIGFIVTGAIGFLWLILWNKIYYDPDIHPTITEKERELLPETIGSNKQVSWYYFFKYREVWGIALSRFVSDGVFYFFVFWIPSFLSETKGMDLMAIGLFSWIPFLASDIGSLAGGWTGSYLIDRGWSIDRSRKCVIWIGAILVVPVALCVFINSAAGAIAIISWALFSLQFKQSALFTIPIDLFSENDAATVWGISGSAGSFGAMLMTPLFGYMIDKMSYNPVIVTVSLLHILSAFIVVWMIKDIRRVPQITS